MTEVADPTSAAHRVADRHKRHAIDFLNEILTAAGRSDAREPSSAFALLIDGAIVTFAREATPVAADRGREIAQQLLDRQFALRLRGTPVHRSRGRSGLPPYRRYDADLTLIAPNSDSADSDIP